MKKLLFGSTLLMLASFAVKAQRPPQGPVATKQFFVEGGGAGIIFSSNFDGRFKKGERLGFGYRVGLGFTIADVATPAGTMSFTGPGGIIFTEPRYNYRTHSIPTIPIGVNYLFGKPNSPNIFEVGAGATLLTRKAPVLHYEYDETRQGNVVGHASFMYRRQPVNGGFCWRIGFTPIIGTSGDIWPLGAIGLGYSF